MSGVRAGAARVWERAMEANIDNIVALLERRPGDRLLDVGCDDGSVTARFVEAVGTDAVSGVEIVEERAAIARERGIDVVAADLDRELPFKTSSFDVVCSNQVIEHLADTDRFVSELFRVVRPGGYVVTSTENLASWHNIAALVLGWQPFSLSNVSGARMGLGNPVAVHRGEAWEYGPTWQHRRVFAHRGLKELFEAHGFAVEAIRGAGYFPFPARVGRRDPRHAAFLTVKARVPSGSG